MAHSYSPAILTVTATALMAHVVAAHGSGPAPTDDAAAFIDDIPPNYFNDAGHGGLAFAHIFLSVIAWVFCLPVAVMLSIAKSRYTLPVQFLFLVTNGASLFFGFIYNHSTEDMYKGNVHHGFGWAISIISIIWVVTSVINVYVGRANASNARSFTGQPMSAAAMAQYDRLNGNEPYLPSRLSTDSHSPGSSLMHHARSSSANDSQRYNLPHNDEDIADVDDSNGDIEKRSFLRDTAVDKFLSKNMFRIAGFRRTIRTFRILYNIIERSILILGFIVMCTGGIVYAGIFRGHDVFGGLAHFIKGGIFFWYGLFTFGRWMGCFAEFGWAWNVKPTAAMVGVRSSNVPSAEFVESFLIFLYGATNVFLEHLGGWGKEWKDQDLEHLAITIMFFGGGLLGMLAESKRVRKMLNTTAFVAFENAPPSIESSERAREPIQYPFSMNPLPAFVVLCLGLMMAAHHQSTLSSTKVHIQWGNLLMWAAFARGATYLLLFIRVPRSYLPSRPPTELVTSYCLVAAGIIFMESTHSLVNAIIRNGIQVMYLYVMLLGVTGVVISWEAIVFIIKGWAVRKEIPLTNHSNVSETFRDGSEHSHESSEPATPIESV